MLGLVLASLRVALVSGAIEVSGLDARDLDTRDLQALLRVFVFDPERPDADVPSILGSYEADENVLRFRPMFPFIAGLTYRVAIETADGPRIELLTLPSRSEVPETVVSEAYPSADVLPENQLKLYLHFSAPMSGGDGLPFLRLLDSNGTEVRDPFLPLGAHFWDPDRRRYTVFFDPGRVKRGIVPNEEMGRPLVRGERYRLVVDADWRDENGLPLARRFEKSFGASAPDEKPIDPAAWRLSLPRSGTREPLSVAFGEPLDREILRHAIFVEDSRGEKVAGEGAVSSEESVWSFAPAAPWGTGAYVLVALGILEDLAGNRVGRPFEVDLFEPIDSGLPGEEKERYRIPFTVNEDSR
jgi:hypothetical protein